MRVDSSVLVLALACSVYWYGSGFPHLHWLRARVTFTIAWLLGSLAGCIVPSRTLLFVLVSFLSLFLSVWLSLFSLFFRVIVPAAAGCSFLYCSVSWFLACFWVGCGLLACAMLMIGLDSSLSPFGDPGFELAASSLCTD